LGAPTASMTDGVDRLDQHGGPGPGRRRGGEPQVLDRDRVLLAGINAVDPVPVRRVQPPAPGPHVPV
jgi:hypothetical protein